MRITTLGHSCVRLDHEGRTVVVDPGVFSAPDAAEGADAILITHEHMDHVVPDRLREAAVKNPDLEIWTNPALAAQFKDLGAKAVTHGDAFTVAGLDVHVYGEKHATIHSDIPLVDNVGFLIGGQVFHPGDALTVPEERVPTLLAPVAAPWMKISEAVEYVREVAAERVFLIHGAILAEPALGIYSGILNHLAGEVTAWKPGDHFTTG